MKQNFKITNLTCEACVKLSTMALKKLPGVNNVKIDLSSGNAEIDVEKELNWNDIVSALGEVGKTASQK